MKESSFDYAREKRIINALLIQGSQTIDPGLLNGRTGIVIYFYYLSRKTGEELYARFAEELLESVIESLHEGMSTDFSQGIAGIGWSIEFLVRNGFIEAETDEVLEAFDEKIAQAIQSDAFNPVLWIGYAFYYISRLSDRGKDASPAIRDALSFQAGKLYSQLCETAEKRDFWTFPTDSCDFTWHIPWYIWIFEQFDELEISADMEKHKESVKNHLEVLLSNPALYSANRWFLELMVYATGILPFDMPDPGPLYSLMSPAIKNGISGAILLLHSFATQSAGTEILIRGLQARLETWEDTPGALAGYSLEAIADSEKAGILKGLAGIGMSGLI